MKKMMMILALLFAMVGSSFGGVGHVLDVKITKIHTENHHVRVWFSGTDQFVNNGSIEHGCFVFADDTVEGQRKLAVLLSALQNQNPVDLYAYGSINVWSREYYRLNAVYLKAK